MFDKFFLSNILKNRFSDTEIEKIKRGYKEVPFNHLSVSKVNTKLVLSQNQHEPIYYAVQKAMPAACLVIVYYEQPNQKMTQWNGSGFLISKNIVITAGHVLPDENGQSIIKVSFDGSATYPARMLVRNLESDIGILKIRDINITPVPISTQEPQPGEQIAVIGAPEGWDNVVTIGHISAIHKTPAKIPEPSWQDMIFIDSDIYEGSSGSMVINNKGEVIGMVMGIIGKYAAEKNIGQNAVIPITRILNFLK